MKGIMFNNRYGLESAVLRGDKTRTWRADKTPRFKCGEIAAIKQSYKQLITQQPKEWLYEKGLLTNLPIEGEIMPLAYLHSAGYNNKMFVRPDLMPHHIRIIAVKPCRLQDITDEECLREGICRYQQGNSTYYNCPGIYIKGHPGVLNPFRTAKDAFFMLINKLNGWGYWNNNPQGYAYEFELVKTNE